MKYLAVLFWSIVLLQMINFVLNSLNGGGALNFVTPLIGAVVFTIIIILFDLVIKPKQNSTNEQH
ncbi:YjzD family protein [Staphylococcus sp. GSSP0090]|nr:YjzD family protein [Staphylococcus sp. GSSP0090]